MTEDLSFFHHCTIRSSLYPGLRSEAHFHSSAPIFSSVVMMMEVRNLSSLLPFPLVLCLEGLSICLSCLFSKITFPCKFSLNNLSKELKSCAHSSREVSSDFARRSFRVTFWRARGLASLPGPGSQIHLPPSQSYFSCSFLLVICSELSLAL